ncbi:MAG: SDR family NAD(P)-dependent oxidoreductase [Chitinophagales bacterium]|nr:SDR family NAD(P)-dependent oxidoreductase [Chitinophagales bacterium]MDW8427659.1 SDR family NAD(P)-dependent oxidoreductase [Chitinophagales bacterium]
MDFIALVTGVGRRMGLGIEVCRQLAMKGCTVILTARRGADAEAHAALLRSENVLGAVHTLQLDITQTDHIRSAVHWVDRTFGRLDILINNAGISGPYAEQTSTADLDWARQILEVNLWGTWQMCQAFLPLLRRSRRGRIVNVSSGAGSFGDPRYGLNSGNQINAAYAISKAALNALTVRLALDERRLGTPVLVNAVCPGWVATYEGAAQQGARPVADGAAGIVWAALLPPEGPTGQFFRDGKPMPW